MTNERKKEILGMMLEVIKSASFWCHALCYASGELCVTGRIDTAEESAINDFIFENRPSEEIQRGEYFWPPYDFASRITFIQQLIEQL